VVPVVGDKTAILSVLLILCLVFSLLSLPLVNAVEDSWTTLAPMPTARAGIGIAVANGKIYAIGGSYNSHGENEEYNPITNTWTTKTPMPTPRIYFGIAVVENKIYTIGGDSGNWTAGQTVTNINEVYDPATDTWVTTEPIPTAVGYQASAVVDHKIYIIGGAVEVVLNQIYDTETDTWSYGAPLPEGVDAAATGVSAGDTETQRVYVIGGKQNLDAVNLNQVYDPTTDTWVIGTAMPTARYGHGIGVINDNLYVIGGREGWFGFPISAANERYTPAGYIPEFPSWTILPLLLAATLAAAIYRKKLHRTQTQQSY